MWPSLFPPKREPWTAILREGRIKDVDVTSMKEKGARGYNLVSDFLTKQAIQHLKFEITEVVGYAVSLAFWIQLEQSKEGTIKAFWQRLSAMSDLSAEDAARVLSELTGEDIWTKLQNMDLHEVLQTPAAGAP